MNHLQLQKNLQSSGRYTGTLDGIYGPRTRAAVMLALTDGPDTPLNDLDIREAAAKLGISPAHIRAFREVEASGKPFIDGRPTILFEPHRFSRATNGRFDKTHPAISYRKWDKTRYPASQAGRYDQLLTAVGLDVDAGFASASYGAFQILGENYRRCGYGNSFAFALAQAQSERDQLDALVAFIRSDPVLHDALAAKDFVKVALRYNGTAAAANNYGPRLKAAYARHGGK